MSKTCIIIDQTTINTIIGKTNKKDNDTMNSDILNEKRRIANQTFVEACTKLGVYYDNACGQYRDIHTNRFVKRAEIFDTLKETEETRLELSFEDNPTGIQEIEEDAMPALPNYQAFKSWEEIPGLVYKKKEVRKGLVFYRMLVDESGQPIPVKKSQDGTEVGWNEWGKESPAEMFSSRAAYWGMKLEEMGIDVEKIDAKITKAMALATHDEISVKEIADMFREDYIEDVQAKAEEHRKALNNWLVKIFGVPKAREIKTAINKMVEKTIVEAENIPMEEVFEITSGLTKTGFYKDPLKKKGWVINTGAPVGLISEEVKSKFGEVRLTTETWKMITAAVTNRFWYKYQDMDNMEAAKSSKLYAVTQYTFSRFAAMKAEFEAEQNSVDRPVKFKTDWNYRFTFEALDWVWANRE